MRFAFLMAILALPLAAQTPLPLATAARKQAAAVRLTSGSIRIDGRLDEEAWKAATPITDFVQKEPVEGASPTEPMEVRFLFDDGALYVGARMHSRKPAAIQAPLGRRDEADAQAEYFLISLDTYLDHRTAYTFGVTASGVRLDRFHRQDDEEPSSIDLGWDPVWQAKTQMDDEGWTAELWIPYSQLRFTDQPAQVWGLNVRRFAPNLNEQDDWVPIPRTDRAWASRFGELRGVEGIPSLKRIELLPFVVGSSTVNSQRNPANPFDSPYNLANRAGMDVKMGLSPGLTLQGTVNPDFGQVEADPAEVNLTALPTRFAEKRPFFIEGSQLMVIAHSNVFYSRRIGAKPVGPASGDFVDYPATTTILGAAKITGRIGPRTSLGLLAAVTNEEFARVSDVATPGVRKIRVTPYATWAVARLQRELGHFGSTASVGFAGVHRSMGSGDALASLLTRDAFDYGGDLLYRFRGGEYQLTAAAAGSYSAGDALAMQRVQRSSAHYAQRPGKSYAQFDPTMTRMLGYSILTTIERISGRHWLWNLSPKIDSPQFETNDVALLNAADGFQLGSNLRYRETTPGRVFRNYSLGLNTNNEWNMAGDVAKASVAPAFSATFHNFLTASWTTTFGQLTENAQLTRGGTLMRTPSNWKSVATLANRAVSQTRFTASVTVGGDENGGMQRLLSGSFSFRPGTRWMLTMTPTLEHFIDTQQYVTALAGGPAAEYGKRYIFAAIERHRISSQFRINFTLKPDMNLDVYAEPFASSGHYYDYGELVRPNALQRLTYGTAGTTIAAQPTGGFKVTTPNGGFSLPNPDFNVRSYRSTIVLRWEWRPGSTLYLVAQQDKSATDAIGTPIGVGDVFKSLSAPGLNGFQIKTSFWLPLK